MVENMQRDPSILRQRLEEFAHQFGIECTDLRCGELHVPDQERAAGNIDGSLRHRLVHGKVERGITRDALAVAQGFGNRLADGNAGIFHRVVIVDMKVALHVDLHVDQRMTAQLVQHMIEKADACRNFRRTRSIDIHADRDGGLVGLAGNLGCALCHCGCSLDNLAVPYQPAPQISSHSIVL